MKKIGHFIKTHYIWTVIIIAVLAYGGYKLYGVWFPEESVTTYTYGTVSRGNIVTTISGSGQISNSKTQTITAKVTGDLVALYVEEGDYVEEGQVIAKIDDSDALLDLENAKNDYQKNLKALSTTNIENAQEKVADAYESAYDTLNSFYINFTNYLNTVKDMYNIGGGLDLTSLTSLTSNNSELRKSTEKDFLYTLYKNYSSLSKEFHTVYRTSDQSIIYNILDRSYDYAKNLSDNLKNSQSLVQIVKDQLIKDGRNNEESEQYILVNTTLETITDYASKTNTITNSLKSARTNINDAEEDLSDLQETQPLDIKTVENKYKQEQENYAKYTIKAPFSGQVSKLNFSIGDTVSSNFGTIISDKQIIQIDLNEVDVANVQVGDGVNITFDAFDDLTATGTVTKVDTAGTVSSGVVNFVVEISLSSQNDRVKTGMSVSVEIETDRADDVLLIPSTALKTETLDSTTRYYVEVPATANSNNIENATNSQPAAQNDNQPSANSAPASTSASSTNLARPRPSISAVASPSTLTDSEIVKIYVEIGRSDDTNTEITSGLTQGQTIIISKKTSTGTTTTTAVTTTPSSSNNSSNQRGGGPSGGGPMMF